MKPSWLRFYGAAGGSYRCSWNKTRLHDVMWHC